MNPNLRDLANQTKNPDVGEDLMFSDTRFNGIEILTYDQALEMFDLLQWTEENLKKTEEQRIAEEEERNKSKYKEPYMRYHWFNRNVPENVHNVTFFDEIKQREMGVAITNQAKEQFEKVYLYRRKREPFNGYLEVVVDGESEIK
jgi:uncharacterized protein YnzC (UPF0291/DUF896 family)